MKVPQQVKVKEVVVDSAVAADVEVRLHRNAHKLVDFYTLPSIYILTLSII